LTGSTGLPNAACLRSPQVHALEPLKGPHTSAKSLFYPLLSWISGWVPHLVHLSWRTNLRGYSEQKLWPPRLCHF
jgi:hypothetical protein